MAPALAWLTALMVVPCALVLALAFFRRGIYGGIEYSFTLENFGLVLDPLYAGIFLNSARIAGTATLIAVVIG
ncbi:MAG: ABC transporter permease, partial [Mesorhizobium sp.]